MISFRAWLENQNPADMIATAELDKRLHDRALRDNVFPHPQHIDYLIRDKQLKTDFQQIVASVQAGMTPNPEKVSSVIKGLEWDMQNHRQYLQHPPSEKTGSHQWHQDWIRVYQDWLVYLRGLSSGKTV